jgi:hypothetical protein
MLDLTLAEIPVMRLVLTTALVLASGTAFGSSITVLNGAAGQSPSIIDRNCADCPAPEPKADQSSYHVPVLKAGTQKTEIIEINGEKKLVRTEAWSGGSPVVFVSKLPDWLKGDAAIASLNPSSDGSTEAGIEGATASGDGVDIDTTTSAVSNLPVAEIAKTEAAPAPLALASFDLRLQKAD